MVMRAFMGVVMRVPVAPRLAEEGQEHQPPRVEAGEDRRDDQRPEGETPQIAGPKAKALSTTASFEKKPAKPI
jgi:hypothetical protein